MKLFSKNSNLCDHNSPTSQTDRRTDRQMTCDGNTALCTKVHRAVKNRSHRIVALQPVDKVGDRTSDVRGTGQTVMKSETVIFRQEIQPSSTAYLFAADTVNNKKAQLSLTNPRDAKVCQKLLQFDVLTTLSLTILTYLHSFSCCCVRNL